MNKHNLIFFALLFCSAFVVAQSKQKVQSAFLKQLNATLINSKEYGWNFFMKEVDAVTIEKPFTINNDLLSVSINYIVGESITTITMEAKVNKIKSVIYDHYLVLFFDGEEVTKYEFLPNSKTLDKTNMQSYFHIGTPIRDGDKEIEKFEKLLENLLKY